EGGAGGRGPARGGARRHDAAAGDLRRSEHRAGGNGRASQGAQAAGDRTAAGGARVPRADHRARSGGRRAGARTRRRSDVHVVGAVAEHARAKHRVAARLRARQPVPVRARGELHRAEGSRHERPRAGGGGVWTRYCSAKFTVTVMMTGVATPLSIVGVYFHCSTASSAAWSRGGIDFSTRALLTCPSASMRASMITIPVTRADSASGG